MNLLDLSQRTPRVVDCKQQEPTLGKDQQNPVWQQGSIDVMGDVMGTDSVN